MPPKQSSENNNLPPFGQESGGSPIDPVNIWVKTLESLTDDSLRKLMRDSLREGPFPFTFANFNVSQAERRRPARPILTCLLPNEPMVQLIRQVPGNQDFLAGNCIGRPFEELLFKGVPQEDVLRFYQELFGEDYSLIDTPGWHDTQLSVPLILEENSLIEKQLEFLVYVPEEENSYHGKKVDLFINDVTDRERARHLIWDTMTHDPLTGLYNRTYYEQRLEELREHSPVSVLYFDMDGLKDVNDRRGHTAGDCQLILMSELLARALRGGDDPEVKQITGRGLLEGFTEPVAEPFKEALKLIREISTEKVLEQSAALKKERRGMYTDTNFLTRLAGDEFLYLNTDILKIDEIIEVLERVRSQTREYNNKIRERGLNIPEMSISYAGAFFDGKRIVTVEESLEPGKQVAGKENVGEGYLVAEAKINGKKPDIRDTVSSADKIMLALKKAKKILYANYDYEI